MADLPTPPKTFSLGSLLTTRKGFSVLVASVVGTLYAIAMTVSYFQGKFTPDLYFTKLERAGAGVMAAWGLFTWSSTKEDVASKSAVAVLAPVPVTTAEVVTSAPES